MEHKLALIGCGTVGQGFLEILQEKKKTLKEKYGFSALLVSVSDKMKGAVNAPMGIDIPLLLETLNEGRSIETISNKCTPTTVGLDPIETIRNTDADIVIEVTYTDIKTGEPATTYITEALNAGKHVVTSNKGPVALYYSHIHELALERDVQFRFEGSVLAGTPVFNLMQYGLAGCTIRGMKGILNGTTNFILTAMESDGMSYDDALRLAQDKGYAEADPTADVEGYDALAKVAILSKVVFGSDVDINDIPTKGISGITIDHIKSAAEKGRRFKLLGTTQLENGKVVASVSPEEIPVSDPLAGVTGANNALTFDTDHLGAVTIQGPGAGRRETGYSILADVLAVHRESGRRGLPYSREVC
jgi:homoserine dehydrogenase